MASGLYNRFKANLMNKIVDLEADTIKVMLLDSNHSFDADHDVIGDVSGNEVSGTGYTAGGATLAGKAVTQDDANDKAKWDANDVTWSSSTITAAHAVIYDDTVATDDLFCSIDFGGNKSSSGGNFKIEWHANGIIELS